MSIGEPPDRGNCTRGQQAPIYPVVREWNVLLVVQELYRQIAALEDRLAAIEREKPFCFPSTIDASHMNTCMIREEPDAWWKPNLPKRAVITSGGVWSDSDATIIS